MTPTSRLRRVLLAIPVAVLTAVILSACGSTVDATRTEKDLKAQIPSLTESDLKVTSVTCPENKDFKKGTTLKCDYTVDDGSKGAARVTVTSAKGDNGEVESSIVRRASGQVEQFLMKNTEADVPIESVKCPATVKDGTVCTFKDKDGDTGKMTLAFDADGGFEFTPEFD